MQLGHSSQPKFCLRKFGPKQEVKASWARKRTSQTLAASMLLMNAAAAVAESQLAASCCFYRAEAAADVAIASVALPGSVKQLILAIVARAMALPEGGS